MRDHWHARKAARAEAKRLTTKRTSNAHTPTCQRLVTLGLGGMARALDELRRQPDIAATACPQWLEQLSGFVEIRSRLKTLGIAPWRVRL